MTRHLQQWTVHDGIAIDRTAGGAHGITGAALLCHTAHASPLPGCRLDCLLPEFYSNQEGDEPSWFIKNLINIPEIL
jgi:hypothetical protein